MSIPRCLIRDPSINWHHLLFAALVGLVTCGCTRSSGQGHESMDTDPPPGLVGRAAAGEGSRDPEPVTTRATSRTMESPSQLDDDGESQSEKLTFTCLDGREVDPFANPATDLIVLVFISTDCPIANAYHPHLQTLHTDYSPQGVSFFLVHSTRAITSDEIQAHADEYQLSIPIVLDQDQTIATALSAEVTPEVIVLPRHSTTSAYRGAIDNLHAGYGKKRPAATEHYLRDALDQLLAG